MGLLWIGLVIVLVAYGGFIAWTIFNGTFRRVFMGTRIVSTMIFIELIGLGLMLLALIVFLIFGFGAFAIAEAMMILGLLCAVPAAIYLIVYMAFKLFATDEVYEDENINAEWFEQQQEEAREREAKATMMSATVQEEITVRHEHIHQIDDQIAQNQQQAFQNQYTDPNAAAELERQREDLEAKKEEERAEKQRLEDEQAKLERERELLRQERERLEADKQRLEVVEENAKQAQVAGDAAMAESLAVEAEKIKTEANQKHEQVEAELAAMREQLAQLQQSKQNEDADTNAKKQQLEQELAVAKQQLEAGTITDEEYNRIQGELENNMLQLGAALARIEQIEQDAQTKKDRDREKRVAKAAEMKAILSRENIDKYIQKYFIEVSACFLMNRNAYKDRFGLSPYNRIVVIPSGQEGVADTVNHLMTGTEDKLYKFAEMLIDVDRFIKHKMFNMFKEFVNEGTSLVRISEKLHLLYLQFYKKDFVRDYRYKEDFENILILVSHHYLTSHLNFKQLFVNVPFEIKPSFTDQEIVDYLANPIIQENFAAYFPNYEDLGFANLYEALTVCFTDSRKDRLSIDKLVKVILKESAQLSKMLEKAGTKKTKKAAG
ncbi:MAG: hypothetical protein FWE16_01710 [Firmicutes bacterium]|nr:hypothetical protein [Bacillota bacterium]